jgi:hypothetical protein
LGPTATPRFPSPLIKPDEPISGIRLSDWLHRKALETERREFDEPIALLNGRDAPMT